ncbi:P-loop containing nucleoside triphosphate hydrolase protein [Mytilinidion resinicola]|uniref:Structural maintenance of chromosomes protein 5 n=1 Tax=Mytilinidion resinicola TaxID=574789 RepID=A0A6A6YQI3_9PEZI|nr:P-loop containing nucleoside triphosphate hydrolase protein [Mytilinidion resinicola]KAF2810245.1 P-loop containing nucleoside triphosphate hydrolase protein [Mytilinidion resinicola]
MPGLTTSRRRTRDPDESEDENVSDSAASSSSMRSGGSKRARLDDDALSEESESPVLPDSYRNQPQANGNGDYTLDPHQPGSIVRITLTNFVTYTAAEFLPGPSLNMIIGPNGTGKSTLVCAICLGLGWSASNLGRAKDIVEYIKHGAREAEIEIELAGGRQTKGKNPVIRTVIKREGQKKGNFFLNGRACTQKQVVELARSFSIQIDNLCQFLPQDRVVEFAQMTPVEKLRATQQAVASDEVVKMHGKLIEFRQTQKRGQVDQKTRQDTLNGLLARQNAQRADVERLKERQSLLTQENALKSMRPFIEYRQAKAEAEEAKQAKKEAKANLIRLQREAGPSMRATNAKQAYRDQIKDVLASRKSAVRATELSADGYTQKLQAKEEKIKEIEAKIEAEKRSDDGNKKKIVTHERNITRLKGLLEEEPAPFDALEFNKKIRDKERLQKDLEDAIRAGREEQGEIRQRVTELGPRKKQLEKELEELKSQSGQQTNKLRTLSPDTAKAWTWVQENGNHFEGEIYGPPIVTCSIKDPRYADAIESMISKGEFCSFTCSSKKDMATLQNELLGRMNLHDINIRMATRGIGQWEHPIPNDDLAGYGLEAWLINLVEGPEPVLSMLCENANLHRTAVTRQRDTNEQFEKIRNSPIQTWVAGQKSFRILHRKDYGSDAVSIMVRPIHKATYWTDQPIDAGAERDIKAKIGEIEIQAETERNSFEELRQRLLPKNDERKKLMQETVSLRKEKDERQKLLSNFRLVPDQLADAEAEKSRIETERAELRQRIATLRAEIQDLQLEKGQLVLDYANAIENLRIACVALMDAEILYIEASSEFEAVAAENKHVLQMIEETRQAEADITAKAKDLIEKAKKLARKCEQVHHNRTVEEAEFHETHSAIETMEELNSEIESVMTRLELMTDGNPRALAEYEKRAQEIEITEAKLSDLNAELEQIQNEITEIRAEWEPQVDALVERISDGFSRNFKKIGCAGQVQIDKHEDFDQWAIEILVRFRENEELAILDSHRQSGGERAVSTIFYLMALQDMARSPFRVVDEINQGMDPRNERMVHERMVDIACQERTSQYFLITPKLLNGLKFHPKMKVHCIASGEYMPEDYNDLDFPSLLEIAMRVKGRA